MLQVTDLAVNYGPIRALKGVSLSVPDGAIVSLIGSNGAGKSTTLRAIAGLTAPSAGTISFNGAAIGGTPAEQVVRQGIALVPEGRRCFSQLTVAENLRLGAFVVREAAVERQRLEEVFSLFPRLKERGRQLAGTLSGGEQQMLAIGRALMAGPKLLMLDEPSMGLAPKLVGEVRDKIREINARGVSILLVEQNANLALTVSTYCYVLETGSLTTEGPSEAMAADDAVRRSYLGG